MSDEGKPYFDTAALKFLRGLKRNNDRAWFNERKPIYETKLKAPLLALIAEVNDAMEEFAPEFVRDPAKSMMRIYRDTRFSNDKKPYKEQVAAWWARRGLEKTSGGGFYLHCSSAEFVIAAGVYMPEKEQLLAIRRHLLSCHEEVRSLLDSPALRAAGTVPMEPNRLTRAPKGFEAELAARPAAADLVLQRQWGVSASFPAEFALHPRLASEIILRFRLAAPLVALLNEPLLTVAKPLYS